MNSSRKRVKVRIRTKIRTAQRPKSGWRYYFRRLRGIAIWTAAIVAVAAASYMAVGYVDGIVRAQQMKNATRR